MTKKYRIKLTEAERTELHEIVKKGKAAAYKRLHAQILLKADEGDGGEKTRIICSEAEQAVFLVF